MKRQWNLCKRTLVPLLLVCALLSGCAGSTQDAPSDSVEEVVSSSSGTDTTSGSPEMREDAPMSSTAAEDIGYDTGMAADVAAPEAGYAAEMTSGAVDGAGSIKTDLDIDRGYYFPPDEPPIEPERPLREPQSGTLTAGEWNDNANWGFFQGILKAGQDWMFYQDQWQMYPTQRIAVTILDGSKAVAGAAVTLYDQSGGKLWTAVTDNQGHAWLFYNLFAFSGQKQQQQPARIVASCLNKQAERKVSQTDSNVFLQLANEKSLQPELDLMLVFDTTGSMDDELNYLQKELESVVKQVKEKNGNIPIRVSVNFYRDVGDEYVVRPFDFTEDIALVLQNLRAQTADGGGDYEEAVEQALNNAINQHSWQPDSTKLLFLILDAPPHNETQIISKMHTLLQQAASKGIRIIPVASSGIDKSTEFLLRTCASVTGGTYVFLTDDSGVGNEHIEPTIGAYTVEKLNALLVRVINSYLK